MAKLHEGGPRRWTAAAALVLIVVVGGAYAALGNLGGGPSGSGPIVETPEPTPEPPLLDEAACPIPDPGAVVQLVESTGGSDPDASGGRLAMCDRLGQPLDAASVLTCVWSADRSHVRIVSGTAGVDPAIAAYFEIQFAAQQPPQLTVLRSGVAFRSADPQRVGGNAPNSSRGVLGFRDVPALVGPTGSPNPDSTEGIVRWACDMPPAPIPGEAAGTVRLTLDGFAAAQLVAEATCRWVGQDGEAILFSMDTYTTALRVSGIEAGVSIHRNALGAHELPEVDFSLTDPADGSGRQVTGSWLFPLALSPDQGAGTLRFRGFTTDVGRKPDLPDIKSGVVSWRCDPPLVAAPPEPEGYEPHEKPPTRLGTGTIRLGNPLDDDLPATVTCTIRNPDPANPDAGITTPQIDAIRMEATYQGERLILLSEGGSMVLERLGNGGSLLGEYVAVDPPGTWGWQDADAGPHRVGMGRLAFEPTDPRYVPLGGPGGPEKFELAVTVHCPPA